MRKLANDANNPKPAGPAPAAVPGGASATTGGATSSSKDSDRVPRTPSPGVWTEQIQKFEAVMKIHGRPRTFNQQRLLGAESSLAKMASAESHAWLLPFAAGRDHEASVL